MLSYVKNKWLVLSVLFLVFTGCTEEQRPPLDETVALDYENTYASEFPDEFTLENTIALALNNNLDARIAFQDYLVSLSDADLQKLNALPDITAKADFITRNNDGASSSISAETGVESLEPSISTETTRITSALEANWDVLDSAISIYRSKSALDRAIIAEERLRKVQQNVIMDTYSGFWRLAAAQFAQEFIEDAQAEAKEKLRILKEAKKNGDLPFEAVSRIQEEIILKRGQLLEFKKDARLTELEFKALLTIPPEKKVKLKVDDNFFSEVKMIPEISDVDFYIQDALTRRPEIREELLNLRISERNLNATVYETFPGLNILVAGNYDENQFLEDQRWLNLTATLSQSITRLLTLPARYQKAEKEIELSNARRKALVAAVVSQVQIGHVLLNQARRSFEEEQESYDLAKELSFQNQILKENGLISDLEAFSNHLSYQLDKLEYYNKAVDIHIAHARLMNSIGYDLEEHIGLSFASSGSITTAKASPLEVTANE